ncbi:adenosylmethionine decarboxylase [Bacteroides sp. 224]|uniref:adenosylmethionine decarboxylase n=1 Tax=Bacteroides sp. 224 TaxID=2302936 RepID=UPI0013D18F96|nr:adenosylmethionine decarboxylase [Bacteroides sp. 224]NDV65758.1 adenosylmethionine decarboxylase [Bacteroides sp. 224]
MNHQFKGSHILAELYGVSHIIGSESDLKSYLEKCCKEAGVTLLKYDYAAFDNGGYTAFTLLAESHISIHTYPEYQSIFLDVFTCGNANTRMIVDRLCDYYLPERTHIQAIERGNEDFIK